MNPYITDQPVYDHSTFVGRTEIWREVLRLVRHSQDNALVLYGQRRIGKTSALLHFKALLPTQGDYRPIYFDLQNKATWTVGEVICELANHIAQALNQAKPDLGKSPKTAFMDHWLPNVLHSLPAQTALVLLFDEFEAVAEPKTEQAALGLFPYLRQLLKSYPQQLNLVWALGRHVDDLDQAAVALFRGIPPLKRLSLLNQQDTTSLVRLSEANHSLNWSEEGVDCVWQYTQGHPFLTQQVCFQVWARARESIRVAVPTAGPTEVEEAMSEVLEASRQALLWLWDSLPPAERVVATAVAEAERQPLPGIQAYLVQWLASHGIHLVIQELQEAPQSLQEWDWLEATDDGYRFRVALVRRWLLETKPLRRVQQELDRMEPVAERLFRTAQALYQNGDLESAIKPLREAIELNPHHLGAHQLLADIWLAQGQVGEARALLEKLYHYQPVAARSRLIQALLALALQTKREAQQLKYYEQVLTLEPQQPEALVKRRDIWQQQAETALARSNFKMALAIYQRLDNPQKIVETEQKIQADYFELIKQRDTFNKSQRYFRLALALTVGMLMMGVWLVGMQHVDWFSQQSLRQADGSQTQLAKELAQANGKVVRLEQAVEQEKVAQLNKIAQLEQQLAQANQTVIQQKQQLAQAHQQITQLKQAGLKFSEKTKLEQILSQLETGDQIVIVGSFSQQHTAKKALKKLRAAYPQLFYPQAGLMPDSALDNLYQNNNMWEIYLSGFYSYQSAKVLKKAVLGLDLIEDAFIKRKPFR